MNRRFLMGVLRDSEPAPGGGDPPPAALTIEAIKALLDERDKKLTGRLDNYDKRLKDLAKPPAPPHPVDPTVDPVVDPPAPPKNVDPEVLKLRRDMEAATKKLTEQNERYEAAEKRRMEAEQSAALAGAVSDPALKWKDADSKDFFTDAIRSKVSRNEDGVLGAVVGTEFIPLPDFVKQRADKLPHLFAPNGDGGAGASAGRTAGSKVIDVNSIGPGSSAADKEAYRAQIAEVLRSGGH